MTALTVITPRFAWVRKVSAIYSHLRTYPEYQESAPTNFSHRKRCGMQRQTRVTRTAHDSSPISTMCGSFKSSLLPIFTTCAKQCTVSAFAVPWTRHFCRTKGLLADKLGNAYPRRLAVHLGGGQMTRIFSVFRTSPRTQLGPLEQELLEKLW